MSGLLMFLDAALDFEQCFYPLSPLLEHCFFASSFFCFFLYPFSCSPFLIRPPLLTTLFFFLLFANF
jgi:hypothetical protein